MTPSAPAPERIAFDAIEIDVPGRRLRVAGRDVPLEPKAFDVLVLLAGHAGRAFSRDEILDSVWGHRHVTPAVLSRVVAMLRQALGESGAQARYLHTLHGVGYRFDALPTSAVPAAMPSQTPDLAQGPPDVSAQDDSTPTAPDVTPDRRGVTAARARLGALAIAVVLLVAIAGAMYRYRAADAGAPASRAAPLLIALPLRAVGSGHEEGVLAAGISEELITRLARIDGLRMIGSTTAERAAADKLDAAQLAERIGVTHVLEGSLRAADRNVRIDLRLVEAPSGRALWAQEYDREIGDALALERDVAAAVAAALRLRVGLASANAGPADPALFRAYLELRSAFRSSDLQRACGEALPTLRTLVAAHPGYAPAQGLLARVLGWNLCADPPHRDDMVRDATQAAQRALELDANSDDAHAALGIMACQRFDWQGCLDETRAALAIAPADAQTRVQYTYVLGFLGYGDQALQQAEAAWYSDPLNYWVNFSHARILDTLGRHEEARHYFEAMPALDAAAAQRMSYGRSFNALWRHDLYAARDAAAQIPETSGYRESHLAVIDALGDPARWPQAEAALAASEAATGRYNFARLFAPPVDAAAAMAAFEANLRQAASTYSLALWQPEYAALRRDPAFQDYLRRTRTIDYWRAAGWPAQCRPEGDGARCD